MKNIELKAKYPNQKFARLIAKKLKAKYMGTLKQTDVYFKIKSGRLKLRINNNSHYELIDYKRSDIKAARESEYEVFRVKNGKKLLAILKEILTVSVIVKKEREVYIDDNVRIHVDWIRGLGKFLELEAVCRNKRDIKDAPGKIKKLASDFKIQSSDIIKFSYSDLLLKK
jgi:adenylate cyclase class 2